jgi:hypothetical protein
MRLRVTARPIDRLLLGRNLRWQVVMVLCMTPHDA